MNLLRPVREWQAVWRPRRRMPRRVPAADSRRDGRDVRGEYRVGASASWRHGVPVLEGFGSTVGPTGPGCDPTPDAVWAGFSAPCACSVTGARPGPWPVPEDRPATTRAAAATPLTAAMARRCVASRAVAPSSPPPLRRTSVGRPESAGADSSTTRTAAATAGCPKTSERKTCSSCAGSDATAAGAVDTTRTGLRPIRDRKSSSRSRTTPISVACWSDIDPSFLHRIPSLSDNASGVTSYLCTPISFTPGALPAGG